MADSEVIVSPGLKDQAALIHVAAVAVAETDNSSLVDRKTQKRLEQIVHVLDKLDDLLLRVVEADAVVGQCVSAAQGSDLLLPGIAVALVECAQPQPGIWTSFQKAAVVVAVAFPGVIHYCVVNFVGWLAFVAEVAVGHMLLAKL